MKKVSFHHSTWAHNTGGSFLFNGEQYCAIGLICKSYGIADHDLYNHMVLNHLSEQEWAKLPDWMSSTANVCSIMNINDSEELSEQDTFRELKIKLAKFDIDFGFCP